MSSDPYDVLFTEATLHSLPLKRALEADGFEFDHIVNHRGDNLNRVTFIFKSIAQGDHRTAKLTYLSYSRTPANLRYRIEITGVRDATG